MTASRLTAALALAMVVYTTAGAATLQVQFKQGAGDNDQAGWTVITDNGPPVPGAIGSGEFAGLSFNVTGTHVRSHNTGGSNYALVNHSDGDLDNLLSGGVITNTNATNVSLTLNGLADGDYSITTYHHTPYSLTNDFDFDLLLSDSAVTNDLIHDDVAASFGGSVTTAGLASLVTEFTVSGGDAVLLTFDPDADFDFGTDHLNLNGFELSAAVVPEPASLAVWSVTGLGLAAFGCFRGRRKK